MTKKQKAKNKKQRVKYHAAMQRKLAELTAVRKCTTAAKFIRGEV